MQPTKEDNQEMMDKAPFSSCTQTLLYRVARDGQLGFHLAVLLGPLSLLLRRIWKKKKPHAKRDAELR